MFLLTIGLLFLLFVAVVMRRRATFPMESISNAEFLEMLNQRAHWS